MPHLRFCSVLLSAATSVVGHAVAQQFAQSRDTIAGQIRLATDLDGDGVIEAVVAQFEDELSIMRFDGLGRLHRPALGVADGLLGANIDLGDIDGDGDLDLLTQGVVHSFYVYEDGLLVRAVPLLMPPPSEQVRAWRFIEWDGDGDEDLVVFVGDRHRPVRLELYLNDGSGNFSLAPPSIGYGGALPSYFQPTAADVDGDGREDLYAVTYQGLLLLSTPAGFRDASATLPAQMASTRGASCFLDADADGDLDAIVESTTEYRAFENTGGGVFQPVNWLPVVSSGGSGKGFVIVDLNGDGRDDVIHGPNIFVWQGGGFSWTLAPFSIRGAADLDANGTFDWIGANAVAYQGLPTGTRIAPIGDGLDRVGTTDLALDFDGDGAVDLLSRSMVLMQNDGSGRFTDRPLVAPLAALRGLVDFEADGDQDIVYSPGNGLRVLVNDGLGQFSHSISVPGSHSARAFAAGDFDGNGEEDYVCGGLFLQSNGWFRQRPLQAPDADWLQAVDFEGDGDLDLLFSDLNSWDPASTTTLFINDGSAGFSNQTSLLPANLQRAVRQLVDLDGDGDLDVVHSSLQRTQLFLRRAGGFQSVTSTHLPPSVTSLVIPAIVDVDLDGDPDLLASGSLLRNDGAGRFASPVPAPEWVNSLRPPVVADIDGDGDADIVDGAYRYDNLAIQLEVVSPPHLGVTARLQFDYQPAYGGRSAAAIVAVDTGRQPGPVGPAPGGWFLDPQRAWVLGTTQLSALTGRGTLQFAVPSLPSLRAMPLWLQGAVVDRGTLRRTNVVTTAPF